MVLFTIISAENLVAPPPPTASGGAFLLIFQDKKTKNLGYSEKILLVAPPVAYGPGGRLFRDFS